MRATASRRATVRAFAKINLSLLVLGRRPDGYHEIRTIFQTISLADRMRISFRPGGSWSLAATPEIPGNLAVLAAQALRDRAGICGAVTIDIDKRIPMGGGLGGGSSDAAAVLLALPVLTGRRLAIEQLQELAAGLGSDVPFFLDGGTALGLGRGEELYPLPSPRAGAVLVLTPGMPVATPEAYRWLARPLASELTSTDLSRKLNRFRALVRGISVPGQSAEWRDLSENDFEAAVVGQHPRLNEWLGELRASGARPARMSGSGSALFAVFDSCGQMERARRRIGLEGAAPVRLMSGRAYRSAWLRSLGEHVNGDSWPPRSRYATRT